MAFGIPSIFSLCTCMQWIARPGPVKSFLWQIWHLKCRAFWCFPWLYNEKLYERLDQIFVYQYLFKSNLNHSWISTASSSNSRLQYQHQGRTDFLFLRPILIKLWKDKNINKISLTCFFLFIWEKISFVSNSAGDCRPSHQPAFPIQKVRLGWFAQRVIPISIDWFQ